MDTENLKDALILALNFGQADHFLDTISQLNKIYEAGSSLKVLENTLFLLAVDLRQMNRRWRQNQQELAEYRQENEAYAREEEARQAAEDRRLSGQFTDEEGDREELEAHRSPPRRAA